MRGLKSKRVLITGGASGIGAATAARFLEEGAQVCVLDRDAEANKRIKNDLPTLTAALNADVTNLDLVKIVFAEAVHAMGGVDVLINNAGISIRHNFLDITPEDWQRVLAVNLTGVFYVAQTAARHMIERGSGVILQTPPPTASPAIPTTPTTTPPRPQSSSSPNPWPSSSPPK